MARPVFVAVFVSPHGFGHAARACAIMQALFGLEPGLRFEVFTLVPEWFFADSLTCPFRYHALLTDVGLAQVTALTEDLEATLAQLAGFMPFGTDGLDRLATDLRALGCALVISDISPLGIAAAGRAGIPSVLVENFTWDWIYEAYLDTYPAFEAPIAALARRFADADLRIQTEPVCRTVPGAVSVAPVSRAPRAPRDETRRRLGLPAAAPVVLVTMGGVPWQHRDLDTLGISADAFFVVPGASDRIERRGSLVALPNRSGLFHPDLVHAADAIVGKLGYSTLAEAYAAGVPFAYVARDSFRESEPLTSFVARRMAGLALTRHELEGGTWLGRVPELLSFPRREPPRENGSGAAARLVRELLRGPASSR